MGGGTETSRTVVKKKYPADAFGQFTYQHAKTSYLRGIDHRQARVLNLVGQINDYAHLMTKHNNSIPEEVRQEHPNQCINMMPALYWASSRMSQQNRMAPRASPEQLAIIGRMMSVDACSMYHAFAFFAHNQESFEAENVMLSSRTVMKHYNLSRMDVPLVIDMIRRYVLEPYFNALETHKLPHAFKDFIDNEIVFLQFIEEMRESVESLISACQFDVKKIATIYAKRSDKEKEEIKDAKSQPPPAAKSQPPPAAPKAYTPTRRAPKNTHDNPGPSGGLISRIKGHVTTKD